MKMAAEMSMMNSVRWLDDESHTVRLAPGTLDDWRMNGNIDAPTLPMMPAMPRPPVSRAASGRRPARHSAASSGPAMPRAGTAHSSGWAA